MILIFSVIEQLISLNKMLLVLTVSSILSTDLPAKAH